MGFHTRADTNRVVQSQKMARGLKFPSKEVEVLYYLYRENKGADQLCGNHAADLRLCFCICNKAGFFMTQLILATSGENLLVPYAANKGAA